MDRWLMVLPRWAIAFVVIAAGIAFIIFSNPPVSVCDQQVALFKDSQKRFLYLDKGQDTLEFDQLRDRCITTNAPGGCLLWLDRLKRMVDDIEQGASDCEVTVANTSPVPKVLFESLEWLVVIAWGEKPPVNFYEKAGWLDSPDLALFCRMKLLAQRVFAPSRWTDFQEKMFKELPGAKDLNRNEVWDLMLLSLNCTGY